MMAKQAIIIGSMAAMAAAVLVMHQKGLWNDVTPACYRAQLVSNYLNWRAPRYSADFSNPHRQEVVAAGASVVPALIGAHSKGARLSPSIAQALGEIGDPAALAFLREAFKSDPRQDIALAIGSSWRASGVDETFMSLDEPALGKLLSVVLSERWDALKDKDPDAVKRYVLEHLEEIIKNCKQRSKPLLG